MTLRGVDLEGPNRCKQKCKKLIIAQIGWLSRSGTMSRSW